MAVKFFRPQKILDEKGTSPARVYADGFLYENLGKILPKRNGPSGSSGQNLRILDIGCGSGYVREIFDRLGFKVNYTGLDLKKHKDFDSYNKHTVSSDFIASEIEKFNTREKFDFIISMFALEHIENDRLAVQKISQMLAENGMQFHMAPSKISFLVYFKHGYRRYNPRIIRTMFKNPDIYRICGFFSFLTHFIIITFMKRLLKTTIIYRSRFYPKILSVANVLDRFLPICPIAYIIISKK